MCFKACRLSLSTLHTGRSTMMSFGDLLTNSTVAAFIRLALLIFAFAGGIVGTIVTSDVNNVLQKVTKTEGDISTLASATVQARADALAAGVAVQTARTESNRRFDELERSIKEQSIELHEDTLKAYKLDLRIGCLERKVVCP